MSLDYIPSGESLAREFLLFKWFFRDRLGYEGQTRWVLCEAADVVPHRRPGDTCLPSMVHFRASAMDLGLKGKVVIVTGGASGIGAAIVRACGLESAVPVMLDHDETAMHQCKFELSREGVVAEAVRVELTDSGAVERTIEHIGTELGHIDGLVNNAGTNDGIGLEQGSPELFTKSLERNLVHYYTASHAALPFLKESKGSIVNIASKVALTGQGGTSGYAAAKGAILSLTMEWAEEVAQHGVRVNSVVPAEVLTPQYLEWLKKFADPEQMQSVIASKIPLGRRMTEPDEVAAMATFLLSPKSSGITGEHLFVDGGYVHLDRRLT